MARKEMQIWKVYLCFGLVLNWQTNSERGTQQMEMPVGRPTVSSVPWFPRDAPRLLAEQSAPSEGPCISIPQNLPLPASWSSKIHTVDTIRKLWLYIFEYVPCITGIPSILVGQA